MRNSSLAILAAVSLALLMLAILDPWQDTAVAAPGRVLPADAAESLSRLSIGEPGQERLEIAKGTGGQWRSVGDKSRAADPNVVREVISALGLLRASRRVSPQSQHELSAKSITLEYQSVAGEAKIAIGALTSDERHRWIQVDGGKALLVEAHLVREILDAREHLLSRRLLESRPRSTETLRLSSGDSWVQVQEGAVSWTGYTSEMTPAPLELARSARLRDALGELEVLTPLPGGGCEQSVRRVIVEAGEQSVEIRECGPCADSGVALWTEEIAGCVEASLWNEVVQALSTPVSLVELAILPTRRAESPFTLRCGEEELQIDPDKVDDRRLDEWWQAIDGAALSVQRRVPSKHCSLRVGDDKTIFGRIEESWYARVPDSYISRKMNPEAAALLRVDASLFESLDLIAEDPLFATRIEVREGERSVAVERSELLDAWRSTDGSLSDGVATEWALGMREELAHLRALRFAPATLEKSLEKKPGRRVLVDFENPVSGQGTHYELRVGAGEGECLAQAKGKPVVILAEATCQRFRAPLPAAD